MIGVVSENIFYVSRQLQLDKGHRGKFTVKQSNTGDGNGRNSDGVSLPSRNHSDCFWK